MIVISILFSSVIYLNFFYQNDLGKNKSDLNEVANTLEYLLNRIDNKEEINDIFNNINNFEAYDYFYLDNAGEGLFGNLRSKKDLEFDVDITNRIINGENFFTLYNRNQDKDYLLVTRKINNGGYLIVTKLSPNPFKVHASIISAHLVLLVCMFFVSLFISERTIDDFIGSIEEQARNTPGNYLEIKTDYKELYPFIRIIRDQNEAINRHVKYVEHQTDTLEAIISNMQEGMILLDNELNILTINNSAIELLALAYKGVDYRGVNLKGLLRSIELSKIFSEVLKNPKLNFSHDVELNERIINVLISPVTNGDINLGFVIFLVDETKQKILENQRREFSANVSHELKTPLTSINGYAEMMMSGIVKEEDMVSFSKIIYQEGRNLLEMIDEIIMISKLDEGDMELDVEPIDLGQIIDEILDTLKYKIENKDVIIKLNLIRGRKFLYNRIMLKELLMNLIDNAIKYNVSGGTVSIDQEIIDSNILVIKIQDTGIGISEEDQLRVFERFYTVDRSHNRKDSSGLGLAIVKHITKLLGGTIELESKINKGSEFVLQLPIENS